MNNNLYAEWLVKRKNGGKTIIIQVGLIALAVIGVLTMLITPFGFIVAVLAIGVTVIGFQMQKVEYEYIFVTDELQLTPIVNQQRRRNKKKETIVMEKVQLVAPISGHELDSYMNNQRYKRKDFSSGEPGAKTYGAVVENGADRVIYILEPNEKILHAMKCCAPRKVLMSE